MMMMMVVMMMTTMMRKGVTNETGQLEQVFCE